MRVYFTSKRSIAILIFLILGILFIAVPTKYLMPIIYWFMCIPLIISGIVKLTLADKRILGSLEYRFDIFEGVLSILVGVISLNFREYPIVTFILGLFYVVVPICRIIYSKTKKNQMLVDCLKYLTAFILITSYKTLSKFMCIVLGCIFIAICVFIFITLVNKAKKQFAIENGDIYEQN